MKKLLQLYVIFFKLGIMNFGGGYALLPLLQRELVDKYKWATDEEIMDYYAIGQCTPGAIAVNVSTFIGCKIKGVIGGVVATIGFISPALIIIVIIAALLYNFSDIEQVQSAFKAIRVCVFVLVLFAVIDLAKKSIVDVITLIMAIAVLFLSIFTSIPLYLYVIIAGIIGIIVGMYKERNKKNLKDNSNIESRNTENNEVEEVKDGDK